MVTVHASTSPLVVDQEEVAAPFQEALLEVADEQENLVLLAADLSRYTDVSEFVRAYPERFVQVGMAEQNLMGVAAGLAKTGSLPLVTTYCVFATRRAYEQVALALCTGSNPAIIAAFLPGITTPFKATHQGTDDLALMRNIPGMTVIDPMDATELAGALKAAARHQGVVYMRGLRGRVARVLDPVTYEFEIGASYQLRDGADIGVISTGLASQWALEAAELAQQRGREFAVLHVPTIKPIDADCIAAFARRYPAVVTVENHNRTGGLGSAVAEVLSDIGRGPALHRLGVPDQWPAAGSLAYIREQLGLDAEGLVASIESAYRSVVEEDVK